VAVEGAGAAFRAGGAPEPDVPDDCREAIQRVFEETVALLRERGDPEGDGS